MLSKRTLFAHFLSMLGSWWGIVFVTAMVYFINPISKHKLAGFFLWIFVPTMVAELSKFIFKRPRPVDRGEPVLVKAYGYSFPSSHTVAAVMTASWIILVPEARWWSYLFLFWPVLVAWSRVRLRAHDTIDVIAGLFFGALATFLLGWYY